MQFKPVGFGGGVVALLVVLAGCGGSSKGGRAVEGVAAAVDTTVSAGEVALGAGFTVACTVVDAAGAPLADVATEVEVSPATWSLDGAEYVPSASGFYAVTCLVPAPAAGGAALRDPSPATVLVRAADPASARAVHTRVDPAQIAAGADALVTCLVVDAAGAALTLPTTVTVSPDTGVAQNETRLTGERVGRYDVACALADGSLADPSPAPLSVVAGAPARLTTSVAPETVGMGEPATVTCALFDAYDNPIAGAETRVEADPGVTVAGHTVSAAAEGQYTVTCRYDAPDGKAVAEEGATLTVDASEPARIELVADPERTRYAPAAIVTFAVRVFDENDRELAALPYTLTVPEGVAELSGARFRFQDEGRFTFRAVLDPPWNALWDEVTLICDGSGPFLRIIEPPRGSTFDVGAVTVVGEVSDATDVAWVKVNDVELPIDPATGQFTTVVASTYGLNVIAATAADVFNQRAETTAAYYYSTAWVPPPGEPANPDDVRIPDSFLVYLGQEALDDGDHDRQNIDDLATLIEILLSSLDIPGLVGTAPLFEQTFPDLINFQLLNIGLLDTRVVLTGDVTVSIRIAELVVGEPHVSLRYHEGGMDLGVAYQGATPEAAGLDVSLALHFGLDLRLSFERISTGQPIAEVSLNPSMDSASSAGVHTVGVEASFDLWLDTAGGVHVDVASIAPVFEGFDIDLVDELTLHLGTLDVPGLGSVDLPDIPLTDIVGPLSDLVGGLIDGVLDWVADAVFDLIAPFIGDAVTLLLEQVLGSLAIDLPIPLPALPGSAGAVELRFSTELSSAELHPEGGTFGLGTALTAPKAIERDPLGSILRAGCLGLDPDTFAFDPNTPMALALSHDVVNELLFALWWGGGINLTLDEDALGGLGGGGGLPLNGISVELNWLLPPIVTDCSDKGFLELQVGDLFVVARVRALGNLRAEVYVDLRIAVELHGNGDTIGFGVVGEPQLTMDFTYITPGKEQFIGMIEGLIRGFLPQLIDGLSDTVGAIPLPALDLATFVPGLPPGTTIRLGDLVLTDQTGYVLIGGALVGAGGVPAAP